MNGDRKQVSFAVNEHNWILLFEKLHTVIMRATTIKLLTKNKKISDDSGDRCDEVEARGGVKVRSKLYDTSKFFERSSG